jgi:nucleotide-binding universal stress UspA family protein
MLKINSILCPVDFSVFSVSAFAYAESLAHHYDSRLTLLHVVSPMTSSYAYDTLPDTMHANYWDRRPEADRELERFAQARTQGLVKARLQVIEGPVIDAILSTAERESADLITMGTHGRAGKDRLLLGSVTERILRKANYPVLTVCKPSHGFVNASEPAPQINLRHILYCTDFSAPSEKALDYALSLASEYDAELTLLHVIEHAPKGSDLDKEIHQATNRLEGLVSGEARNWCRVKTVVRVGKPYEEILQVAVETDSELITLSVRGRGIVNLALFGSTTHRVIQLGCRPVLTVRA